MCVCVYTCICMCVCLFVNIFFKCVCVCVCVCVGGFVCLCVCESVYVFTSTRCLILVIWACFSAEGDDKSKLYGFVAFLIFIWFAGCKQGNKVKKFDIETTFTLWSITPKTNINYSCNICNIGRKWECMCNRFDSGWKLFVWPIQLLHPIYPHISNINTHNIS